ncbi:uncharacterized protein LOC124129266 [Haliotis rufescens]|uniref:uncharacterized protein LOC124129266 n=1 Tax=Haliotis rufescens TaxID=6454 RepID=UPI00201F0337|nr:uncharacterized protein LOC124129266 [Haliotis rufescens]
MVVTMIVHIVCAVLTTALCKGYPTDPGRLRVLSISAEQEEGSFKYSVQYRNSIQANTSWEAAPNVGLIGSVLDADVYDITEQFSGGVGWSVLTSNIEIPSAIADLYTTDALTSFMILFEGVTGHQTVQGNEIRFPLGQDFSYTPGEPLDIVAQFAHGDDYNINVEQDLNWVFLGIDNYRMTPVLEIAASFDPIGRRFVPFVNTTQGNGYTEVSATVNLMSQEGVVFVHEAVYFDSRHESPNIFITDGFYIHQEGLPDIFPSDFIGFFTIDDIYGRGKNTRCRENASCSFECNAVGREIESVVMRNTENGRVVAPVEEVSQGMVHWTSYRLDNFNRADQGNYACTATNRNGLTKEWVFSIDLELPPTGLF